MQSQITQLLRKRKEICVSFWRIVSEYAIETEEIY
jgi:hypothetical protein